MVVLARSHPGLIPCRGEVQEDEHLNDQEKAAAPARCPRVSGDQPVGKQEGQRAEQRPRRQLGSPVALVQHLPPLVALGAHTQQREGQRTEEHLLQREAAGGGGVGAEVGVWPRPAW